VIKYWWVNHSQSARFELSRGYIWSPVRESNGARSQFYDNMRLVRTGDIVLSFADGLISHVGTIMAAATAFAKPMTSGAIGTNWAQYGWLVPIEWRKLKRPVRPASVIADLRPYLPPKYSPIHLVSGRGNQKAYLAAVSVEIFDIVEGLAEGVMPQIACHSMDVGAEKVVSNDFLMAQVVSDLSLSETEREQSVMARRGQGKFRSNVLKKSGTCPVSGITNPELLVASHIKPWARCETADERLDGFNGLMLSPNVDYLFDAGYISFNNDGSVLRSLLLSDLDVELLGLKTALLEARASLTAQHETYMRFHRTSIFI